MNNYASYNSMGVYTAANQFDFDPIKLSSLGFSQEEIGFLGRLMQFDGRATVNNMVSNYGLPYEQAKKIKYMYDICTGRVVIDSTDDLCKHLRKLFGQHRRVGIADLAVSTVGEIPRKAVVGGIPKDTPFVIWNSARYPVNERMYTVVDVTGSNIIIETERKPVLKYKQAKFIEGVLEIKELSSSGKLKIAINKQYCRLCNRFVIVASFRRPEFHHGMVEIICIDGTKVYIFADTVKANKYSRFSNGTQRVYDYGFYPAEIKSKLLSSASKLYQSLCGVYATTFDANKSYEILSEESKPDSDEIEID